MASEAPVATTNDFAALLKPDNLSALMRATWTWDDRALRRDLATLLVDLDAAAGEYMPAGADPDVLAALRNRALTSGAHFVSTVLGPKLLVGTGSDWHPDLIDAALDPACFARAADASTAHLHRAGPDYIATHVQSAEHVAEPSWHGLAIGGSLGLAEAFRAYGYSLSDAALFGNIGLAWQALKATPDSVTAVEYADRLEQGAICAAFAAAEMTGSWDPALVRTRATKAPGGWRLTGVKNYVPAAGTADILFVIARSVAGPSLFAVDPSAQGVQVDTRAGVDPSRPLFDVALSDTPAELVSDEGRGGRLMSEVIDLATTALAAEQVGLIERAINVLTDRSPADTGALPERVLEHAAAVSLWRRAVEDPSPITAAAAHIGCSKAAVSAATAAAAHCGPDAQTDAILRRAISANLLFGGPAVSHERLLERLGI